MDGRETEEGRTMLAQLRARAMRRHEKALLKDNIATAREELAIERGGREALSHEARALRERMERLALLADELAQRKEQHKAFVVQSNAQVARRNEPLTQEHKGMMLFQNMSQEVPHRQGASGVSTKRTAFTTDYSGKLVLGASERVLTEGRLRNAAAESDRRKQERLTLPQVAPKPSTRPPTFGDGTYAGKPSYVNLDDCRHRSSKRTRYYSDYTGNRIRMDPSDWPNTEGVLLT